MKLHEQKARVQATLAGSWWASNELSALRRTLVLDGLNASVAAPPRSAETVLRGVRLVLNARRASCLERSLVIQAWLVAGGHPREIIIGVRDPTCSDGAMAHAWIDGYDADCSADYHEIRRIMPRLD